MGWQWWRENGANHVNPKGDECPEGFSVGRLVSRLLAQHAGVSAAVDFGCGRGRIAHAFQPDQYIGLDVNRANLADAARLNPSHAFAEFRPWDELPNGWPVVASQVLLHMPQDDLASFVELCDGRAVVIMESMSSEWRREGIPPVWSREPNEYLTAFADHDLLHAEAQDATRYAEEGRPRSLVWSLVLGPR